MSYRLTVVRGAGSNLVHLAHCMVLGEGPARVLDFATGSFTATPTRPLLPLAPVPNAPVGALFDLSLPLRDDHPEGRYVVSVYWFNEADYRRRQVPPLPSTWRLDEHPEVIAPGNFSAMVEFDWPRPLVLEEGSFAYGVIPTRLFLPCRPAVLGPVPIPGT